MNQPVLEAIVGGWLFAHSDDPSRPGPHHFRNTVDELLGRWREELAGASAAAAEERNRGRGWPSEGHVRHRPVGVLITLHACE